LDELSRQLLTEVGELSVDSVDWVSEGPAPDGTKAVDFAAVGQMIVTLAPTLIPPLFELLKSWVERKPSTPVKIKVKVGKRTAQIEFDPTSTSAKELEGLVRSLGRTVTK
jgi:hypothetical protein